MQQYEWKSIAEVISEFELSSGPEDLTGIRDALRDLLKPLHPDKAGGEFASEADKSLFHRLLRAIEFVDQVSNTSTALAKPPDSEIIVRDLCRILTRFEPAEEVAQQTQILGEINDTLRSRYRFPRFASGVFLAIAGGALTFLSRVPDYPLLGAIFQHELLRVITLGICLVSGLLFVMTWVLERREKLWSEHLLSEDALAEIFSVLCRSIQFEPTLRYHNDGNSSKFTRRYYARLLRDRTRLGRLSKLLGLSLDARFFERIAKVHLQQLLDRGAVRETKVPGVDVWYEIDPIVADKAENDPYFRYHGHDFSIPFSFHVRSAWQKVKRMIKRNPDASTPPSGA